MSLRALRGPAVAGVAVAVLGYLWLVDPNQPGHYPVCPIRAATGWYCPGCGGLRAVHAALHGDPARAWHANAAIWLVLPALAVLVVRYRSGRIGERTTILIGIGMAAALVGFGVLRNLPGFEAWHP